jgi:(p)ppGpp synthase/HD superfamily hydrolase
MVNNPNEPISERIEASLNLRHRAWRFAAECHQGQLYPGTKLPYLTHLGMVVLALLPALEEEPGLEADLALCCAILHDTVEDTGITCGEIEAGFGRAVAQGVSALSKDPGLPKGDSMRDSLERIKAQPREIWLVKLADRVANLGAAVPMAYWGRVKCQAYADEGEVILEALGSASKVLSRALRGRILLWRGMTEGNP